MTDGLKDEIRAIAFSCLMSCLIWTKIAQFGAKRTLRIGYFIFLIWAIFLRNQLIAQISLSSGYIQFLARSVAPGSASGSWKNGSDSSGSGSVPGPH